MTNAALAIARANLVDSRDRSTTAAARAGEEAEHHEQLVASARAAQQRNLAAAESYTAAIDLLDTAASGRTVEEQSGKLIGLADLALRQAGN